MGNMGANGGCCGTATYRTPIEDCTVGCSFPHRVVRCVPWKPKNFLEVGVALMTGELFFDIEFATNRIARVVAADEEGNTTKIGSTLSAQGKENEEYINRLIESAVKKLRSSTSWASGERGGRVVSDVLPEHVCDWTFVFHVPLDWRGEADVLCSLCHDYVKNRVVADWLKLVAPKMAESFDEQAEENMRDVKYELRKEKSVMPTMIYDLTGAVQGQ